MKTRHVDEHPAVRRFVKAGEKICALIPEMTVLWCKVRSIKLDTTTGGTASINRAYDICINPDFIMSRSEDDLLFIVAHEVFHPALAHYERAVELGIFDAKMRCKSPQAAQTFNIAADMVINRAVAEFGMRVPDDACQVPDDYTGDLDAESLWRYLQGDKQLQQDMQGGGKDQGKGRGGKGGNQNGPPAPGRGCGVQEDPNAAGEGDGEGDQDGDGIPDARATRQEIGELARSLGRSGLLCEIFIKREKSIEDWEKLLRGAFKNASSRRGWEQTSYARPKRAGDALLPRYKTVEPSIAVIVDVSGSMARPYLEAIVNMTYDLSRTYPYVRTALVTHTEKVEWSGWITGNTPLEQIWAAVQYSGGTLAQPAYNKVEEMCGSVDVVVHFTDMYIESPWPEVPGRRLYVGDFSQGGGTQPPPGSRVVACKPANTREI